MTLYSKRITKYQMNKAQANVDIKYYSAVLRREEKASKAAFLLISFRLFVN